MSGDLKHSDIAVTVFIGLFVSAIYSKIVFTVYSYGLLSSALNTFNVSAVVWFAAYLAISLMRKSNYPPSTADKIILGIFAIGCLAPLGTMMWAVLTMFGAYLFFTDRTAERNNARAGWLIMAMTVPMFWGRRIFQIFSEYILSIDAGFVSLITNTERISNLVRIPGRDGYLEIADACSSFANVSLAILLWVAFTQHRGIRWSGMNIFWCLLGCLSIMAINTFRISLIGFFPEYYSLIHGETGATVAAWLYIIVTLLIYNYGTNRVARTQQA